MSRAEAHCSSRLRRRSFSLKRDKQGFRDIAEAIEHTGIPAEDHRLLLDGVDRLRLQVLGSRREEALLL
jgi:hypothetical protein